MSEALSSSTRWVLPGMSVDTFAIDLPNCAENATAAAPAATRGRETYIDRFLPMVCMPLPKAANFSPAEVVSRFIFSMSLMAR